MKTYKDTSYKPKLQCEEHSVFSVLPCPWPSCENGVSYDKFNRIPLNQWDKPAIYIRKESVYPKGVNTSPKLSHSTS